MSHSSLEEHTATERDEVLPDHWRVTWMEYNPLYRRTVYDKYRLQYRHRITRGTVTYDIRTSTYERNGITPSQVMPNRVTAIFHDPSEEYDIFHFAATDREQDRLATRLDDADFTYSGIGGDHYRIPGHQIDLDDHGLANDQVRVRVRDDADPLPDEINDFLADLPLVSFTRQEGQSWQQRWLNVETGNPYEYFTRWR